MKTENTTTENAANAAETTVLTPQERAAAHRAEKAAQAAEKARKQAEKAEEKARKQAEKDAAAAVQKVDVKVSLIQRAKYHDANLEVLSRSKPSNALLFSTNEARANALAICRNVYQLVMIKKRTGQKLGINFGKPFIFKVQYNERTISTERVQTELNLILKVGNKNAQRERFEETLIVIFEEIFAGSNLDTEAEVQQLKARLIEIENAQAAAKAAYLLTPAGIAETAAKAAAAAAAREAALTPEAKAARAEKAAERVVIATLAEKALLEAQAAS